MRKGLLGVVAALFIFSSCSEEIDLTAPYKDITVVYGLLDAEQGPGVASDTVWIRIQKAFLGDDNALLYSVIPDSLYYPATLDAWIKGYNTSGSQVDSFHLTRTVNEFVKDPGVFSSDSTVLYRGVYNLNTNNKYKIFIKKPNGDTTYAETILCNNVIYPFPPGTPFDWEPNVITQQNQIVTMRWTHDPSSFAYQLAFTFNYEEWTTNNPTHVDSSFTYYFPMFEYSATYACMGNQVCYDIDKPRFYQMITDHIQPDPGGTPPGDEKIRQFISFQLDVYQASEELYNYITINAPSLSYVQKVTAYTNITNGLGIFGSRTKATVKNLILNPQTADSLRFGQYTAPLNFQ